MDLHTPSPTADATMAATASEASTSKLDEINMRARLRVQREQEERKALAATSATDEMHSLRASQSPQRTKKIDEYFGKGKDRAKDDITGARATSPRSRASQMSDASDSDDEDPFGEERLLFPKKTDQNTTSTDTRPAKASQSKSGASSSSLSSPPPLSGVKTEPPSSPTHRTNSRRRSQLSPGLHAYEPARAERARRSTARTTPYSYTLSLQRPSETRQAMMDAKHSAAVKMDIIKREDYKLSSKGRQGDFMDKLIRSQQLDESRGVSRSALQKTVDLIRNSGLRLPNDGSSQGQAHTEQLPNSDAMDLDKEGADRSERTGRDRVPTNSNVDRDLHFWTRGVSTPNCSKIGMATFTRATSPECFARVSSSRLKEIQKAQEQKEPGFSDALHGYFVWFIEAVLSDCFLLRSRDVRQTLDQALRAHSNAANLFLMALHEVMGSLGIDSDKIDVSSFSTEKAGNSSVENTEREPFVERPEDIMMRLQIAEGILSLLGVFAESAPRNEALLDPDHAAGLLWTVFLANDPCHDDIRARAVPIIEKVFDSISVQTRMGLDRLTQVCTEALRPLKDAARAAIVSTLPNHSMKARFVQRSVATALLLDFSKDASSSAPSEEDGTPFFCTNLTRIETMLATRSSVLNPSWQGESESDFDAIVDKVRLLSICLGDFPIQIIEQRSEISMRISDRHERALEKLWRNGLNSWWETSSSDINPSSVLSASTSGVRQSTMAVSRHRVGQIKSIASLLHHLHANIRDIHGDSGDSDQDTRPFRGQKHSDDDLGAAQIALCRAQRPSGLARKRAKDALQYLNLSLIYSLNQLGYHTIDRVSESRGQTLLTSFMKRETKRQS